MLKKVLLLPVIVSLLVTNCLSVCAVSTPSGIGASEDLRDYKKVLDMFHTSISCNWSNADSEGWDNVDDPDNSSYLFGHFYDDDTLRDVGYMFCDINHDGQSELFVARVESAETGYFYDMYTVINGEIIHVITAGERDRYQLAEDLSVNNSGSGSAVNSSTDNLRLDKDGSLRVNKALIYDGYRDEENPYFYATTDYFDKNTYEMIEGALKPISKEEAMQIKESFPKAKALDLISFDKYDPFQQTETITKDRELVIFSDYNDFRIRKGSIITLSAGILSDGSLTEDVSGITFRVEENSVLKMIETNTKDNCRYVKLEGVGEGTAKVVFSDSVNGDSAEIPITVYDDNYLVYTLNSVPTQNIEKYPTNVYDANGLYIDSYQYTVNADQSAVVTFDVYNTNYTYGAVEVYDENGNMKDAVLIEKTFSSNTSIKEALWDNIGYLARDIIDGDFFSYRQETGYSKKTSVSVKIPKNGYVKITNDPENSLIVGFVNSVDCLMSLVSLAGDAKDYKVNSKEFSEKLTLKLLTNQIYVELIKDGSGASKELWKNVGKETFVTSESLGNFADTVTQNIDALNLGSIIADTAETYGWKIGEKAFTYFSGPVGTALNLMFTIGKVENIYVQQNDLMRSAGSGSIYIQNQGGGFRSCQQVKIESENSLGADTALNVFTVTLDSDFLNDIKESDPEIYKAMSDGITHTYNISLIKNGAETQPDGKVTVYIPISEDFENLGSESELNKKIKIYRVEEDGKLTEMDVKIKDGCFVFTTNHFSLYSVVGYDFENTAVQNNKEINPVFVAGIAVVGGIVVLSVIIILIAVLKKKRT